MGPKISAYIILMVSIGAGGLLSYFCFGRKLVIKTAMIWGLLVTVSIFTSIYLVFVIGIAIAVMLKDESPEVKVLSFIAYMPVLPLDPFIIPFPGLNFLWDINFTRYLVLLLLFPLAVNYLSNPELQKSPMKLSDTFFLMFFLVKLIILYRVGSPTNILRAALTVFVEYGVPYLVISRFLQSSMSINWFFAVFLMGSCFISVMSIFESLLGWRMYGEVLKSLGLRFDPASIIPYARSGLPRAAGGAFMQPLAFSMYSAIAFVAAYFMWQQKQLKFIFAVPILGLLFVATMFTGSRGGLLILIIGVVMLYYMKMNPNLRLVGAVVGIAAIFVGVSYINSVGLSTIDSQGTFEYRVELMKNSMNAIKSNPILGSSGFTNDAQLQRSMQGEGIIDIVNMYIVVALQMGFMGLIPFVLMFVFSIREVWVKKNVIGTDHKSLLVAILVMIMVFIGTCSPVSYLHWYLVIFLAVARAYSGLEEYQPNYHSGYAQNHMPNRA